MNDTVFRADPSETKSTTSTRPFPQYSTANQHQSYIFAGKKEEDGNYLKVDWQKFVKLCEKDSNWIYNQIWEWRDRDLEQNQKELNEHYNNEFERIKKDIQIVAREIALNELCEQSIQEQEDPDEGGLLATCWELLEAQKEINGYPPRVSIWLRRRSSFLERLLNLSWVAIQLTPVRILPKSHPRSL